MYYNVVKALEGGKYLRSWDEKSQVPYAIDKAGNSFLSYDDVQSVGLKAEYVKSKGARGVIIWEITGDAMDDGSHPLLAKIGSAFGMTGNPATSARPAPGPGQALAARPMRAHFAPGRLTLEFGASATEIPARIVLRDSRGRALQSWGTPSLRSGRIELELAPGVAPDGKAGLYSVEVRDAQGRLSAAKLLPSR
jgi:hypothetical protein